MSNFYDNIDSEVEVEPKLNGLDPMFATLVEYDPVTRRSTIDILGEEVPDIPKMRHVSFGGTWEPVHHATLVSGSSYSIPVDQVYDSLEIAHSGTVSTSTPLQLRLNNHAGATSYRRTYIQWTATGGSTHTTASAHADGSVFFLSSAVNTGQGDGLSRLARGPEVWSLIGRSRQAQAATTQIQDLVSGRATYASVGTDISSLDLLLAAGTFSSLQIDVYGRLPDVVPGATLLCVRSKQNPLTIVGVYDGATV